MFSRFKALENFGEEGLERIQNSLVAIVGLGATGSVVAEHLGRHGANLLLLDRDYLEENDAYSSDLYLPEDCEKSLPKAKVAEKKLSQITEVRAEVESINPENIQKLKEADLIIDGTDNMDTRLLLNEFSKKEDIPWIYTAVIGEKGYSCFFDQKCFNCVFEQLELGSLRTCETAGVMREVSTIAASLTSWKAVKFLAGKEVEEKLETVGLKSFELESPGCKVCEEGNYERLNSSRKTVAVCGENKYQLEREVPEEAFKQLKDQGEIIAENEHLTRVKINGREFTLFNSGRAIIEAEDKGHAEALFSEVLGL